MIDNDLNNQVHSQWHGSVQVSYQAGSAWRHSVFFIQDEKMPIFITGLEGQEERAQQNFWTSSSIPSKWSCFGFYQMRKVSAKTRWWTHKTTISLFYWYKMYQYWRKPNTQSTSWRLWWSLVIVMLYLHLSFYMAPDPQQKSSSNTLNQKGGC